MNSSYHAPAFRPAPADASFVPAFREPRRDPGYSTASSHYSQRRYTGKAPAPLFRCS